MLGSVTTPPEEPAVPTTENAQRSSPVDSGWCEERRWVMGTQLRIVIALDCGATREALDAAFGEAQRWDELLSNYDPASPLSRLNANAGEMVEIPRNLFLYLERAKKNSLRTDGVFDITVGPLVQAYRTGRVESHAVADALELVGAAKLEIHAEPDHYLARLTRAGMALDPGGDGKGIAIDAMVRILRKAGVTCAFLDFGGSTFYGLGAPPGQDGWPVAVQDIDGCILGVLPLKDQALSVSSSLRRDLSSGQEMGKAQLTGHIVDPRDGSLISAPRTAVVLSLLGVEAEVLSTALVVAGTAGVRFCHRFQSARAAVFESGQTPLTKDDFDRHFQSAGGHAP